MRSTLQSQAYVACPLRYVKWISKIRGLLRGSSRIFSALELDGRQNNAPAAKHQGSRATDSMARIVLPNSSVAVTISVATSTTLRRSVREYRRNLSYASARWKR